MKNTSLQLKLWIVFSAALSLLPVTSLAQNNAVCTGTTPIRDVEPLLSS
jgi:hypothetical protein